MVIKRIPLCKTKKSFSIFNEEKFLQRAKHLSHVAYLLDSYTTKKHLNLIFRDSAEFYTDMASFVVMKKSLAERTAHFIFLQLIKTVVNLKNIGILHSDLTYSNVLINWINYDICLIDFGAAQDYISGPYLTYAGALICAPPEWFQRSHFFAESVNSWQLGKLDNLFLNEIRQKFE